MNRHSLAKVGTEYIRRLPGRRIERATCVGRSDVCDEKGVVVEWTANIYSGFSTMHRIQSKQEWVLSEWHLESDEPKPAKAEGK